MADSNSLILLPPRSTALPQQDASASKGSQSSVSSSDDSFRNKLEKAKKLKEHTVVKKQVAPPPAKAVPAKAPTAAKPTTEAAEQPTEPADPSKKPQKPVVQSEEESSVNEENAQAKPAKAQTLPVAEAAHEQPVEKKPVKVLKPVAGKTAAPTTSANAAVTVQAPVDPQAGAADQIAGGDPDDAAAVKPAAVSEFGTGKVVTPVKGDEDNTSGAGTSADATAVDDAAAASAGALAVPGFTAIESALAAPPAKSDAHPTSQVADVTSAASGLVSSSTTTTATNGIGKPPPVVTPQARFVEDNQPKIISSIQGQLMPHGGTMQLRLDPPELGALSVTVHMRDGVMTASFETSNSDATKMLSHSLGQLKAGLEAAGVSVDKIHVEQGTRQDSRGDGNSDSKQGPQEQQQQAQQDQQRREMVQRMWKKLAGGDPLDLVA